MTTSNLFTIGTSALTASQLAMQTVSHNIANANVAGYSRQQADMATVAGIYSGNGYIGRGVQVQTVTRSYNQFLTQQAALTSSQSSADATRSEQLSSLETVFQGGDSGIGSAVGNFLNSMVDVANNPQDLSARTVTLGDASTLAARFSSASDQLDQLQAGVTEQLKTDVSTVNDLAQRIASVNQQIAATHGSGQTPNDLLDQRDQLVAQLATHLQVSTVAADDGSLNVFIAGGQRLVLGSQASTLAVTADRYDSSRMAVSITGEGSQARELDSSLVASGSIGGLLRFQNDDLVDARNQLGQLATSVATSVNQQQALGLTLGTPASSGPAIFALGSPQVLPANDNAKNASGQYTANVGVTIDDASQLVASDYSLAYEGSSWQLTRLSDGVKRSVASGDVVDGMKIDLGTPAPATTDSFRLQPLARAASGMSAVLSDPKGLAAASPVSASLGSANTGTATIASLKVVDTSNDPSLTATISFGASNAYTWELRDASNNVTSSGSGTWTSGSPIALNGFELQLSGAPASGDTVSVAKTTNPQSNNGNALALAALRDEKLVGVSSDGSGGQTFTNAWASSMAEVGVRAQGAKTSATISAQVSSDAKSARDSYAGVNLDEEAARLMQYQQAYEAAAKVLQVAQSLFDSVLKLND